MEQKFSDLSGNEQTVLLPLVIQILSHRNTKQKVFSNTKIRKVLKEFGEEIHDAQIRKIVFHIRVNNLVPLLIANNEGYYVASNIDDIKKWIAMQNGKIEAMQLSMQAIEKQFEQSKSALLSGEESSLIGQLSIYDLL